MKRPRVLLGALASILGLALLHFIAIPFYFYWSYWWYDVVMHFLAGLSGGLATYWVLFESGRVLGRPGNLALAVTLVLVCVMVVGVGWEIFEYHFGIADAVEGYVRDTANDLILDAAGALTAVALSFKRR